VNSFTGDNKENFKNILFVSIPIISALMVVALSGGRSAYLGFVAMVGLYFFYYIRNLKVVIPLSILVISFILIVFNIEFVQQRVIIAKQETLNYLQSDNKADLDNLSSSSSGVRLEMWRGSWYLIKSSPIFGVGRGNYYNAMQEYIDAGLVNPAVTVRHSHPHNAFVETMVSRGLLGLLVMLFILYYPFYLFLKYLKKSPTTALMGMTHIILITIFSLTEAATFIKGNFVAINLIFLSLILSSHLREVNSGST
jgi:O-antigen ligase